MGRNEIVPYDGEQKSNDIKENQSIMPKLTNHAEKIVKTKNSHELRIEIVKSQKNYSSIQFFYGLIGVILMIIQMEIFWDLNKQVISLPCPYEESTNLPRCPKCSNGLIQDYSEYISGNTEGQKSYSDIFPVDKGIPTLNGIRAIISFTTFLMLYYQHKYFVKTCELLKLTNKVNDKTTVLSSPLKWKYITELILYSVHPFPFCERLGIRWANLILFLSLMMFVRILMITRLIKFSSKLNTSNGWFISALTNVEFSPAFFLKIELKNHPWKTMGICLGILLSVAGYCLFSIERFMCAFTDDYCCQPISFYDAEWVLLVTILTIGYGDIVPHTMGGRLVAVLGGLMGTLITAVTIALTTNYLNLTRSEGKVDSFLRKDENKKKKLNQASKCISATIKFFIYKNKHLRKKNKYSIRRLNRYEMNMFKELQAFRQVKKYLASSNGTEGPEKQIKLLETMEVNIDAIKSKIDFLTAFSIDNSDTGINNEELRKVSVKRSSFAIVQNLKEDIFKSSKIEQYKNDDESINSSSEIGASLHLIMNRLVDMNNELQYMQNRINSHIKDSDARLTELERKLT